jgi:hypothetical protein
MIRPAIRLLTAEILLGMASTRPRENTISSKSVSSIWRVSIRRFLTPVSLSTTVFVARELVTFSSAQARPAVAITARIGSKGFML